MDGFFKGDFGQYFTPREIIDFCVKMNMIIHDDGHTNVISHDALESIDKMYAHNRGFVKDKFDLVLTNPPFGSVINKEKKPYLESFELGNVTDKKGKKTPRKNQSSEVLFIERIWQFLKPKQKLLKTCIKGRVKPNLTQRKP